jgi:hypothetical protein
MVRSGLMRARPVFWAERMTRNRSLSSLTASLDRSSSTARRTAMQRLPERRPPSTSVSIRADTPQLNAWSTAFRSDPFERRIKGVLLPPHR